MYEIRIFQHKGDDMPTIYHVESIPAALILISQIKPTDDYKIEIVNAKKAF